MCRPTERTYICIDLKSYYASVECVHRGLDPLKANLLVADESRSDQTICLAVSPALKAKGVPSRPRLFEAKRAIRRYEQAHGIKIEYIASPDLTGKTLIIADPMLATGGSMELAYQALLTKGTPAHIHLCSVIASQKGVDYIVDAFKKVSSVSLWCAAVDPELNEHAYIVPGLGDAGDLAYGEKL